jgi:ABC-type multidrug transport system ATPase subunit
MSLNTAAISVKGLTKHFGGVRAVDDLSFDVRAGAITGFLGRNGAGKTSTLRILSVFLIRLKAKPLYLARNTKTSKIHG